MNHIGFKTWPVDKLKDRFEPNFYKIDLKVIA